MIYLANSGRTRSHIGHWYGTLILKFLLVEWTDFGSVCWFELTVCWFEPYFNSCKFLVIWFRRYWEISVYFSGTSVVLGQFWTLVPHLVSLIARRSVNRFWICLLIWTHHEPYFNSCKFRVICFSRFREIGLETYGYFAILVTGALHVSTSKP